MIKGKNILLVSPQIWDSRPISKHHYAKELAKYGANVFFLNPPNFNLFNIGKKEERISSNLVLIDFFFPLPKVFKFHFTFLFRFLLRNYLINIKKNLAIDILWNFDIGSYFEEHYLFSDKLMIFHPVDDFNHSISNKYKHYNVGFSVSNEILTKVPLKKKWFVNHGLNAAESLEEVKKLKSTNDYKVLNVCYLGNLSIRFLDTDALTAIVKQNKNVTFHFIGDYDIKTSFVVFLENTENVILYGKKTGTELHSVLAKMDVFLLCYKKMEGYFADNSHKILEYLSTGNVIVSSRLSVYKELNLFPMSMKEDNSDYIELFEKVVQNFSELNSSALRQKRMAFAFDNTYAKQIIRIEQYLEEAKL